MDRQNHHATIVLLNRTAAPVAVQEVWCWKHVQSRLCLLWLVFSTEAPESVERGNEATPSVSRGAAREAGRVYQGLRAG
jgi:hypothetical protein